MSRFTSSHLLTPLLAGLAAGLCGCGGLSTGQQALDLAPRGELEAVLVLEHSLAGPPTVWTARLEPEQVSAAYTATLAELDTWRCLAPKPDGSVLAVISESGRIDLLDNSLALVRTLQVDEHALTIEHPQEGVTSGRLHVRTRQALWIPDRRALAISYTYLAPGADESARSARVLVLDTTGERLRELELAEITPGVRPVAAPALAVTPHGETLLALADDAILRAWSLETGEVLWTCPFPEGTARMTPTALAVSPDGTTVVASGSGTTSPGLLRCFRLADHSLAWGQSLPRAVPFLAFNGDGRRLVTLAERVTGTTLRSTLRLHDAATGEVVSESDFGAAPRALAVTPGGDHAFVAHGATLEVVPLTE